MSTKFVVSHLDEQLGPFDENELKAKWSRGEILPIDYVYDEGKQDWVLLTERFAWATKPATPSKPTAEVKDEEPDLRMEETAKINLGSATDLSDITGSFSFDTHAVPPSANDVHATPLAHLLPAPVAPVAHVTSAAQVAAPVTPVAHAAPVAPVSNLAPAAPAEHVAPAAHVGQLATPPAAPVAPTQLKLVNGIGEIDLASLKPGQVELLVRDSLSGRIRNEKSHAITVKAAEPNEVIWHWPEQVTVGETVEVHLKALDGAGNVCHGYHENFVMEIRGDEVADLSLSFQDGQASHVFKQTKAGTWHATLKYGGKKRLHLPEKRTLEWQPGPAAKLVIEGPHEYTAGQPLKVQVRAVDEFGNVAKHYQGTVALEVKAS